MKTMKKRLLMLLVVVILVLPTLFPIAPTTGQSSSLQCVPNSSPIIESEPVTFNVGVDESLRAKFYYAKPSEATNYAVESRPGIVMTHGIGGNLTDVESDAIAFAQLCAVVLTFTYRGHGTLSWDIDALSYFQSSQERDDLTAVFNTLVEGPPLGGDLVNPNFLGMTGDSQASLATWFSIADVDLRGRINACNYLEHNT